MRNRKRKRLERVKFEEKNKNSFLKIKQKEFRIDKGFRLFYAENSPLYDKKVKWGQKYLALSENLYNTADRKLCTFYVSGESEVLVKSL